MSAGKGQTFLPERATPRYSDNWSQRVMAPAAGNRHACVMRAEELDDLVQHLAVAKYALEAGDPARAEDAVDAAVAIARRVLTRKQSERGPAAAESMVRERPSR